MAHERVMVVDAEPIVRSIVQDILQTAGYRVEVAQNVEMALTLLDERPPDLVLTNVYLPGMSGKEAIRLFRTHSPGVNVLMVSGLPDADVIREWSTQPGFNMFPKPFTPDALLAKVRQVLDGAKTDAD